MLEPTPVLFHEVQLEFKPLYEWALGEKISHPETTARAESILWSLRKEEHNFSVRAPKAIPDGPIKQLHDARLMTLYRAASQLPPEQTYYPSVFPKYEPRRLDPSRIQHAGGFCFDSGTPLNAMTLEAASWSAACAHEAAVLLRKDRPPITYALSRPPGHHATRKLFGGYCYFNNAAIAARYLRRYGKVVVLDVDFHHGNGTQHIFYRDPQVLFISIHGDPETFYPYFSGRADERGAGPGEGFNLNFPLSGGCDGAEYMAVLRRHVFTAIRGFAPEYFVISAGHDTYIKDPMGRFTLEEDDFATMGEELGKLGYPTLVIQEGGYYTAHLGRIVRTFLEGVRRGAYSARRTGAA